MNWFAAKWHKFLNKSWYRKLTDILFIVLFIAILTPNGRVYYQRILLQLGLFNAQLEANPNETYPVNLSRLILTNIQTQETFTGQSFQNKVVFLNFWATWCPPCKAEIPSLTQLYENEKNDSNIVFLFVSSEPRKKLIDFVAKQELKLPIYQLQNLPQELWYSSLPTTIIINKNSELISFHQGMANWDTPEIYEQLKLLKNE